VLIHQQICLTRLQGTTLAPPVLAGDSTGVAGPGLGILLCLCLVVSNRCPADCTFQVRCFKPPPLAVVVDFWGSWYILSVQDSMKKALSDLAESQVVAGAVGPRAGRGIGAEARPPSRLGRVFCFGRGVGDEDE
jgi:hypothetical protein